MSAQPITQSAPRSWYSWLRGCTKTETFFEMSAAWILLGWGIHLIAHPHAEGLEPVSRAMYQLAPIPTLEMGVFLILLACAQMAGAYFLHLLLRRACILISILFFSFATLSFWRFAPYMPGASIVPAYVVADFFCLLRLARREH